MSKLRRILPLAVLVSLLSLGCESPAKSPHDSGTLSSPAASTRENAGQSTGPAIIAEKVELRPSVRAIGQKYAIATQGIAATKAAQAMLSSGGNLIDAAIAASFAISVERPHSTGIGGGGFFLFHEAKTGKVHAVDFRERAPLSATRDIFIGKDGKPDSRKSQDTIFAVGVPGMVAGLHEIHVKFGKLPFKDVVQPAIDLAKNGFPVYPQLHEALKARKDVLRANEDARRLFLDPRGNPWPVGHVLVQKDLARTLEKIASKGRKGFYEGETSEKILTFSRKRGGLLANADFKKYEVKWRTPVSAKIKDYTIHSMPPPSSGGVHVIQFLKFLQNDDLKQMGYLSAPVIHLAASALQSAFADRASHLGDPDFVKVPEAGLIEDAYVKSRRQLVSLTRAKKADEVSAGKPTGAESSETTHLSLIDSEGNAIASTQTINGYMGSGLVAPGTGIVLNNEMDDFSAQAGAQNMFGAVGGDANAVAPRKTPLSSMSPTFVIRDGKVVMALGAPGGTRIISCVAQTILNRMEFGLSLLDSVASIRYHHQWRPDKLTIDPPGPGAKTVEQLTNMGYEVELKPVGCNVMAVSNETSVLVAVSDPRDIGTTAAK